MTSPDIPESEAALRSLAELEIQEELLGPIARVILGQVVSPRLTKAQTDDAFIQLVAATYLRRGLISGALSWWHIDDELVAHDPAAKALEIVDGLIDRALFHLLHGPDVPCRRCIDTLPLREWKPADSDGLLCLGCLEYEQAQAQWMADPRRAQMGLA